jgi:ABC-type uncharacterized transport system ATPase subunit
MNVELRDIHKTFGSVHANIGIHLNIPGGTIQGLLGENGAGKSTLMKVLAGFIQADRGQILLDGQPVSIASPADAIRCGIGMLHQDPLDFPPLKVIDNFILGSAGPLFPPRAAVGHAFQVLQRQFEFALDPEAHVDTLTVGERQQLEILRLLWLGAQLLILDEPTTGISALQKEKLFATLRVLAQQGKTVIFVSHKLEDVEQLCDRVAVLREGRLVGAVEPPYRIDQLVMLMFGKQVAAGERAASLPGPPLLKLHGLTIEGGRLRIPPLDLQVHAGEVIGLAGMEGSGQSLFLRACAGLVRPVGGSLALNGQDLTGKTFPVFKRRGVAYLPAARLEEGLVPGLTLSDHFILAGEQAGFFIDRQQAQTVAQRRISEFNIRGVSHTQVEALSGGNQQRALLALLREPLALILLEHPTRGLDVESTIEIWRKLKERCRQGTAIVFISSDLEEILQYSDRILVFFAGQVSPPLLAAQTSVDELGQRIGGKNG